jgi:hypothetical protein
MNINIIFYQHKVLKNQTHFLFCETIQEPEWEDIPNESLVNI